MGNIQHSIRQWLARNSKTIDVPKLTDEHIVLRIVHSVIKNQHLAPTEEHRSLFQRFAHIAEGSPHKTNTLCSCANRLLQAMNGSSIKCSDICPNEQGVLSETQKVCEQAIQSLYTLSSPVPRHVIANAIINSSNNVNSMEIFQFLETMRLICKYPSPTVYGSTLKESDMVSISPFVTEHGIKHLLPLLLSFCK